MLKKIVLSSVVILLSTIGILYADQLTCPSDCQGTIICRIPDNMTRCDTNNNCECYEWSECTP